MTRRAPPILKAAARRSRAARIAARDAGSAKHIPYVRHLDPCTLETRSGDLVQVIRVDGKSFETEDAQELDRLKSTRNTLLRAMAGGDYALWQHIVRRRVQPTVSGKIPPGFAADLDRKWFGRLGDPEAIRQRSVSEPGTPSPEGRGRTGGAAVAGAVPGQGPRAGPARAQPGVEGTSPAGRKPGGEAGTLRRTSARHWSRPISACAPSRCDSSTIC